MASNTMICRHRSKYGWFLFRKYYCDIALAGKKWKATKAVCQACRGPEYEMAYDCLYYRVGGKKIYSDKNEVIIYEYCFLPPHNAERSVFNQIKPSDRCGLNCNKQGYKKRPFVPVIEETIRNRKDEEKPWSQKSSFWEWLFSTSAKQESPEDPKASENTAAMGSGASGVGLMTVREVRPVGELRPSGGTEEKIEKEKLIEGLLNKAKEQANYAEYEKAIELFEKVLATDSQNAKALEGLKKATADRSMKRWFP